MRLALAQLKGVSERSAGGGGGGGGVECTGGWGADGVGNKGGGGGQSLRTTLHIISILVSKTVSVNCIP